MNHTELREYLESIAENSFRDFSCRLIPADSEILGIRIPELRNISKEIFRGDWQAFLNDYECTYMEEKMLKGMVICLIKNDPELVIEYSKDFVKQIDNWAVCDTFCSGLKTAEKNKDVFWEFILPYLHSENEFEVRFAIVMIISHFICDEYADRALECIDSVTHEGYYVKMAAAWAVSVFFVKYPEKTEIYLRSNNLDDETHNKAIQKIVDSRRVSSEVKNNLKKMKRK